MKAPRPKQENILEEGHNTNQDTHTKPKPQVKKLEVKNVMEIVNDTQVLRPVVSGSLIRRQTCSGELNRVRIN